MWDGPTDRRSGHFGGKESHIGANAGNEGPHSHDGRDGGDRKQELLKAAFNLFQSRGYEATSVQAIADAVGIAKATFYHHFSSKEDLLNQLAVQVSERLLAQARQLANRPSLDALERLRVVLGQTALSKMEMFGVISAVGREMQRPENRVFYARLAEENVARVSDLLADIIAQGVREGTLHVRNPHDTADMLLALFVGAQSIMIRAFTAVERGPEGVETFLAKIRTFEEGLERLLGIEEGRLRLYDYESLRAALLAAGAGRPDTVE